MPAVIRYCRLPVGRSLDFASSASASRAMSGAARFPTAFIRSIHWRSSGARRELEGFEVFVAVHPRFRALALSAPFEQSDDRHAVREQAGQLFGRPAQETVFCRVQVEV